MGGSAPKKIPAKRRRRLKCDPSSAFTIDSLPYPTALLDRDGNVVHAGPGFPAPSGAKTLQTGTPFLAWLESETETLLRSFLGESREPFKSGGSDRKRKTQPALDVGFCDIPAPDHSGFAYRLVPLIDRGDGIGTLVLMLPSRALDLSIPSVAQREMRLRQRLAAVLEVSRNISSTLTRDEILQGIVDHIGEVISVPEVVLFLVEEDGETLKPVVAKVDEFYDEVMAVRLTRGDGIVGYVATTGRAEIVNKAERDPRSIQVPGTPDESSSLLCCPIMIQDELVGVIALTRFGDEWFDPDDLEVVTIFASHCSVAIENARLYENLQSTIDELRSTQNQLIQSAKLNALGEMAGGVAHDFNNILTAILGRTQILLRWTEDEELRDALQVIEKTALDGAQTVRRIQEFTRVRQDHGIDVVDINEVVLDVVELTRPSWEYPSQVAGIRVSAQIDLRATRSVRGRAAELREVLTNLVLNALDAMPEGGVITLATADAEEGVAVRVSDTGVGMDESTRQRVFDPFFTTKVDKGTGLGLSVAYGIVTRHDGEILVDSRPGDGTTFTLQLPAGGERVSKREPDLERPEVRPMRVLCIDDEKAVLEVLVELLESLGHQVEQASGGQEGIAMAESSAPDIVMTDLGMPEINGWQVAEAVKSTLPNTSVVLVTGWGIQIDPAEARERGVDEILPKPYTLEEIKRVLESIALQNRKAA